jgi:hypothetical protein
VGRLFSDKSPLLRGFFCAALVATAGVFAGAGAAFLAAATCLDTGAFAAVVLLAAGFVALVTM